MKFWKELIKGLWKENPIFRLVLGMCPTLAVTTSLENSLGMGMAATFVLLCSNIVVSLIRNFIPSKVRIPCYIVIIASFVTIVDPAMNAFAYPLYESLGLFIPLIVVNCVILGRAEAFALLVHSSNSWADGHLDLARDDVIAQLKDEVESIIRFKAYNDDQRDGQRGGRRPPGGELRKLITSTKKRNR